jgi:hypothetical protein
MSESILEEAQRLIHGDRNKNYGHPRENFADISALFSGYLGVEITNIDVANLMILVKIARVKGTGYHRDSFTDIAGYAGCVERIYEEDEDDYPEEYKESPLADWEIELLAAVNTPRVWEDLAEVPDNVIVEDPSGDWWRNSDRGTKNSLCIKSMGDEAWDLVDADENDAVGCGPFTEVRP